MNAIRCLLSLTLLLPLLPAQSGPVNDVGLTMDGGVLTVIYGQVCGPVTCQPLPGGTIAGGESRTLVHYSAPVSPYVIALGLPGNCAQIAGIANVLLLGPPVLTVAVGLTSAPPFVPTPCDQGLAIHTLTVPRGAPSGVAFRVQSLGVSNSGALGFGPSIATAIQ